MRNWIPLVLTFALSLTLGCDNTGQGGNASGSGEKKTIVIIAKNTGNPYFEPLIEGFKKAAEENGVHAEVIAPATADATSQVGNIQDQVQLGVATITIAPNSPDALNPVLEDAKRKGVHIVTVDSDLTGNEQYRDVGVLTADVQGVGEGQIELLGSLIDYKGKFAILSATTDAPNQNAWIAAMKQTLADNPKYKEMQLVEVVYGNDEPQKSLTEAEALLTKYPDLRGILAPTTVGVAAAAQVIETAKKSEQIAVTGLGTPNQMRRFIKNGTVKAFALWSPYDEGYLAGYIAAQLAKGELDPKVGTVIKAGTLGERTIEEKNIVITGKPFVFTKDNIDQFNF